MWHGGKQLEWEIAVEVGNIWYETLACHWWRYIIHFQNSVTGILTKRFIVTIGWCCWYFVIRCSYTRLGRGRWGIQCSCCWCWQWVSLKVKIFTKSDASISVSVVAVVGGVDRRSRTKSNSGGTTLGAGANENLLCFFLTVVAGLNGRFRLHASRCLSVFFTFKPDRSLPQLQVVTSSDISTFVSTLSAVPEMKQTGREVKEIRC